MSGAAGEPPATVVLLAAVPLLAIAFACYVKIAVVLEVLRGALSSIPPRSVSAIAAVALSAFVMLPVLEEAARASGGAVARGDLAAVASASAEPLRDFLERRTPARERQSFVDLARRVRPAEQRPSVSARDLAVLVPAFVFAELRAAFQVGFLLFLPFLVLELLVASVLTTVGMYGLDPRAVSLPFKLLLFVLADGWNLLARGLVLGYTG